jgi:hypothetical protein
MQIQMTRDGLATSAPSHDADAPGAWSWRSCRLEELDSSGGIFSFTVATRELQTCNESWLLSPRTYGPKRWAAVPQTSMAERRSTASAALRKSLDNA